MGPQISRQQMETKAKTRRWAELKQNNLTEAQLARVETLVSAELVELTLRDLREQAGQTQTDLAAITEMTQAELSRFERRDDHKLSTLRKYVEALGGELEISAVFGNKRVTLVGV
jgi:DNA-binding XRE family transcriptional regulator